MQLTIIIPCYNMGKYLVRCLQSIVNENLTDFEVICVNDGSTDNTEQIFREFKYTSDGEDKYLWLKMIYQDNQGLSGARNTGMNHAKGKYLTFVDPDDTVYDGGLKALLKLSLEYPTSDWILGSNIYIKKNSSEVNKFSEDKYLIGDIVPRYIYENIPTCLYSSTWGKLYRTDVIKVNDLEFVPRMIRGQDTEFNFRYLARINSVVTTNAITYCYYFNDESVSARFKQQPALDAYVKLFDTRNEFIHKINPVDGESKEKEIRLSILKSALIAIYYDKTVKHRYRWMKKVIKIGEHYDGNWLEGCCDSGLEGKLKQMRRYGRFPVHALMTVCRIIPSFRARLRDMMF